MESLFDTIKNTQETKFEIIGKEHQVLQLVLYPGDEKENTKLQEVINVNENENTLLLKQKERHYLFNTQGEVEFHNDSETIGYIGISKRIGKAIVLDALRHFDIYFKADNLLAYSPEMVYDKKQKFFELGFTTWSQFKSIAMARNKTPQIFLQSSHGLIEKELGSNEEIIVNRSSVFAFSSKIKFSFQQPQLRNEATSLVKAKGPGLLYIENRRDPVTPLQNYTKTLLPLAMVWIYIMITFILWQMGGLM